MVKPDGKPELLASISDDRLVQEAMRLQREQHSEQGDVWRAFCSADPERALRGLTLEADNDHWSADAWRYLLWAANEAEERAFQFAVADQILRMPDAPLRELLPSATSWIVKQREVLSTSNPDSGIGFFKLWDRLADLALAMPSNTEANERDDSDLLTESLNRPGGMLAWSLLDALSATKPQRNSGLGSDLKPRFDRLVTASGRPGLLARVYLARALAYFDSIDPEWTEKSLQPRFCWSHPEALALWRSFAHGGIGSSRLFNALKPAALAAFDRKELSDNEFEGLTSNLLSVAIWHQRGEASEYNLTYAEVRRALIVGPASTRKNASWNLWRMMAQAHNESGEERHDFSAEDKATRWRTVIGPLFQNIWPLDANLRSKGSTQNLVRMALECGDAFPEAVDAIIDVIVPYDLYGIAHSLRIERNQDDLLRRYPLAFLKLADALIDPEAFPIPNDLGALLLDCVAADPSVTDHPTYVRLNGLRRQRNA